jgi:hypothetical protein
VSQDFSLPYTRHLLAVLTTVCMLATLPVAAKPAKDRSIVVPTPKQGPVRTDLTPRNKNECLAVARTLREQATKLSQKAKQGVPREFARVASDLNQSCGAEDFNKAWISIEWMNGCLNNFTKEVELGDSVQRTKATLARSIPGQTLVRRDVDAHGGTETEMNKLSRRQQAACDVAEMQRGGPASNSVNFTM